MSLSIATNTGALMAQAALASVNRDINVSIERLSTGRRIASRLTSEIRGIKQAIRNAMDAQSMLNTAEGAYSEVENLFQRMRELAIQAVNDTNSAADRTALNTEFRALHDEIDSINDTTSWAGQSLLSAYVR